MIPFSDHSRCFAFPCVIIEDEPLAAEKLESFVARIPFLKLEGSFDNALEGLQFLKTHTVDLLFLDIQMEKITGIQLLENLSAKPYVVITSAYSDYALKGYELSVFDYLLKPYSFERFQMAVNRVSDDLKQKAGVKNENNSSQIFIKTEYRRENVHLDDILYIEGMQGYLKIYLSDKRILTKQSMAHKKAVGTLVIGGELTNPFHPVCSFAGSLFGFNRN